MTESRDYDEGYYEGVRNTVATLIQLHIQGADVQTIISELASMRDEAKVLWKSWDDEEEEWE